MAKIQGKAGGLSKAQAALAWKFQHTSPSMKSMGDARRCLNECFLLMRGEIDGAEFTRRTGHEPHTILSGTKKPASS